MRVYFDASVLIAALLSPNGGSSLLIQYVKAKLIIGIISETVIEEILDEDKFKKFRKTKKEIEEFIAQCKLIVRESITLEEIKSYRGQVNPEDAHLIAGAIMTKCSYLVTLDKKHLLREDMQNKFLPLKIISPKKLLELIVS